MLAAAVRRSDKARPVRRSSRDEAGRGLPARRVESGDDAIAIDRHGQRPSILTDPGKALALHGGEAEQSRDRIHPQVARPRIGGVRNGERADIPVEYDVRPACHETGHGDRGAIVTQID